MARKEKARTKITEQWIVEYYAPWDRAWQQFWPHSKKRNNKVGMAIANLNKARVREPWVRFRLVHIKIEHEVVEA